MANLDKLLRVVVEQELDSLVLEPGQRPCVVRNGARKELTKTRLDDRLIRRLAAELGAEPGPEPSPVAEWRFEYELDGTLFRFTGQPRPLGWMLEARPVSLSTNAERPPSDLPDAPDPIAPTPSSGTVARTSEGRGSLPGLNTVLARIVEMGASDLHLSASQRPRARVDGDLTDLPWEPPPPQRLRDVLHDITPEERWSELEETNDADFGHDVPGLGRFRVNLFRDRFGIGAVLRLIPETVPTADDLGLPRPIRELALLPKGLVLVTGPTGSGKSTTLAAILDEVNRCRDDHVITIEDPIEFVHRSKRCLFNQREVGAHTRSFATALRAALREDPDVVLVGEMRDLETAAIAIETAETGHLVFGTLHTTSAISTIERLINQFPADRQQQVRMMLSDSLKAVISQNLLKRIGGGRVAAQEILLCNRAVSNLIREGKTYQIMSVMQTSKRVGNVLLNDALLELVESGTVEAGEAYRKASDKEDLAARFRRAGIDAGLDSDVPGDEEEEAA